MQYWKPDDRLGTMVASLGANMPKVAEVHQLAKRVPKIPHSFLKQLRENIAYRRIDSGIQLLDRHREFIESCSPKGKDACIFIGHLAQWVDIGFAKPELIKELLGKFPANRRLGLSVRNFVHLQMAEGFVAMCDQKEETAVRHFQIVLAIQSEIQYAAQGEIQDLITIANFWIARCYRRLGRNHDALSYVVKAREVATLSNHSKTVAVIQILEGWILFQEGRTGEAARILSEAEELLVDTDDYVALGNLNSTYSRIARRYGDFGEALRRSGIAIQEFKKRDKEHRNVARALVNHAYVKRLLALELSEEIDSEVARARSVREKKRPFDGFDIQGLRERVKALREEATRDLIEAGTISARYHDYRGEATTQITYGYLHLDDGNLDLAASRSAAAYRLGSDKKDTVLKAWSRILQSVIMSAKVEEQIVERSGPRRSTRLACEYAREAVEFAKETQNQHLIAHALVVLGSAFVNEGDMNGARSCCDQAMELLKPDIRDQSWEALQVLRAKLNQAGSIEGILREWSRGSVGSRTFQQITEDFAAIVIPKVWQQEGRKISRVAARLSISPKKVRRILRNQGIRTDKD
jgi:tetratricopeptide (TPR) repeat protein